MSTETAAVTEIAAPLQPAAPAVTPETPAPVAAPQQSAADYVREVKSRRPTQHWETQPRESDGKWTADETSPSTPEPVVAADPPPAGPETSTPAAAEPPTGLVTIELPEGHPLRAQGLTSVRATPEEERHIRALVNADSPVRRAQLEAAEKRWRDERTRRIEAEAELRAAREGADSLISDPDTVTYLKELREIGEDAKADLYIEGLRARQNARTGEFRAELEQQVTMQEAEARGQEMIAHVVDVAGSRYPAWWSAPVFPVVQEYAARLKAQWEAGIEAKPDPAEIIRELDQRFLADPYVRQKAQEKQAEAEAAARAKLRDEIKAELMAEFKPASAPATEPRPDNPLGRIPAGISGSPAPATETTAEYVRRLHRRR